jgi:hypothetical protein
MMLSRRYVANQLLVPLGLIRTDAVEDNIRNDAGETASFTRALEFIIAETYRIEYPELRARQFIPIDTRVPAGANSFTWRIWDWAGMAKIISNYADDLPTVEIMSAEIPQLCKGLGIGYTYSLQDLRNSAFMGMNLDTEKSTAARRAHENLFDTLAAFGDATVGLPGFLNNANVPIISAPGTLVGSWNTCTPQEALDDLHAISASVYTVTKGAGQADTMLLPPVRYKRLSTLRMSQYDKTPVLRAFLEADPYIKAVDQWNYLDTADQAGTGPRAVAYKRDPNVAAMVEPMPFTQHPPQAKNLGFTVPCESRVGGVSVKQPLKMAYADNI